MCLSSFSAHILSVSTYGNIFASLIVAFAGVLISISFVHESISELYENIYFIHESISEPHENISELHESISEPHEGNSELHESIS